MISTTQMEAIDNAGRIGYQPLVIRINPDHFSDIAVSGVTERYMGLQIVKKTLGPTALTVQASFTRDFQSPPAATHHASGFTVA